MDKQEYIPTDEQVHSAVTHEGAWLEPEAYDRWLENLKDQLRAELRAEDSEAVYAQTVADPTFEQFLERTAGLVESWKEAERPFSDSDFDSDDSLAALHAVGSLAVHETQTLAKALRETQERSATPSPGDGAARSRSVAEIYDSSPLAPILLDALNHKPGDLTSGDFQRGYFAALTVTHVRGAAALEGFNTSELTEWEYGWRSFFPTGEEYEWLATHSRADAEQQIKDYQEEEDAGFIGKLDSEGKLTYSLWRRRKSEAGPWERVEETTDGQD